MVLLHKNTMVNFLIHIHWSAKRSTKRLSKKCAKEHHATTLGNKNDGLLIAKMLVSFMGMHQNMNF